MLSMLDGEGEQVPPGPQSASTRQLPGTHAFPAPLVYAEPWHAHVLPAAQSESLEHASYVHPHRVRSPPIATQRPPGPASAHCQSALHVLMNEPGAQLPGGAVARHCESPGRWSTGAGDPEEPLLEEVLPPELPELLEPPELLDARASAPPSGGSTVDPPHAARLAMRASAVLVRIPATRAIPVPTILARGSAHLRNEERARLCRRGRGCRAGHRPYSHRRRMSELALCGGNLLHGVGLPRVYRNA